MIHSFICSTLFQDMTKLQQEYVQRVQDKVCQLEIVDGEGVRVLNSGSDGPVVIPTTEELAAYIREKATYGQIERVQKEALQRAEEKVAIAHQTYSLVDSTCKRLDDDLMEMEKLLQVRVTLCLTGLNHFVKLRFDPVSSCWCCVHITECGRFPSSRSSQTRRLGRDPSDTRISGLDLGQSDYSRSSN